MTLDSVGAAVLCAIDAWEDFCKDKKISQPLGLVRQDLRRKFIAAYIFMAEGFQTLLCSPYKDMKDYFRPCDGADGQCCMECKYFREQDYERCRSHENYYSDEIKEIIDWLSESGEFQ